ncbi:hypothetical protein I2456_17500 [Mycobacterium kubicae]|uniref:Uncharacterized protein n=1 Tax=Mycobacterium kubicae TaxID=120959 RepID=A0AAX1J733_9MYCO|nr:hypothetical protein [Mycobacterium kubicae]QPI36312.1 hypothetical protein I2456_17500 [Mycobacterium kubicae]
MRAMDRSGIDTATMKKAAAAGLLDGPAINFAANTLIIVVTPGTPDTSPRFRI